MRNVLIVKSYIIVSKLQLKQLVSDIMNIMMYMYVDWNTSERLSMYLHVCLCVLILIVIDA